MNESKMNEQERPEVQVLFVREENGKHRCVDGEQEWLAKLRWVIDNGAAYADLLGPLLVRRGNNNDWHHYPVPFLFKTAQERALAAERRGKNPPAESWVRRKVFILCRLAGRENKVAA